MKKRILAGLLFWLPTVMSAQEMLPPQDIAVFRGYFYNKEYEVYIRMDAYDRDVVVPMQEIFGRLPGFLGDRHDGRKWLFTDVTLKSRRKALLTIVNDYGSEDLTATMTCDNDSTYTFRQEDGSAIKIARHRKWVKLPKTLVFVKRPR